MNDPRAKPDLQNRKLRKKTLRIALTISLGVLIDLGSKSAALHYHQEVQGVFGQQQPIPILDAGFMSLSLVREYNTGMLFGYLADTPESLWFLVGIRLAFLMWLLWFLSKAIVTTTKQQLALGILIAGALGNLSDNVLTYDPSQPHAIRDFILVTFPGWNAPAFNIADVWITLGGIWYLLTLFGQSQTTQTDRTIDKL